MTSNSLDLLTKCHSELAQGDGVDVSLMGKLGVHPTDFIAQKILHNLSQKITRGEIKPLFDPETQMVFYNTNMNESQAVFKPGLHRAEQETFVRRFFHSLGCSDRVVPGIEFSVDYSNFLVKAEDLTRVEDKILFTEFFFSVEELACGSRAHYLPLQPKTDIQKETNLQLSGKVAGILEPMVPKKETDFEALIEIVILSALLGMRDLHEDAIQGGCLIDSEEVMAVAMSHKEDIIDPGAHMPVLSKDPRCLEKLTEAQVEKIIGLAQKLNVKEAVRLAQEREMVFRNLELEQESLKANLECEEPSISVYQDGKLSLWFSKSYKEKNKFSEISLEEKHLFSKRQIKAFKERLSRFKGIYSEIEKDEKMNLWGIVNIIDPEFGRYCETYRDLREQALSDSSEFDPTVLRLYRLDSKDDHFFAERLAEMAGREELDLKKFKCRKRATSVPPNTINLSTFLKAEGKRKQQRSLSESALLYDHFFTIANNKLTKSDENLSSEAK